MTLNAHKFVLAARSDAWSLANLASTSELDLSGELSMYLKKKDESTVFTVFGKCATNCLPTTALKAVY